MRLGYGIGFAALGVAFGLALFGVPGSPAQAQTGAPASPGNTGNLPVDGATLYATYCTDCHGRDAKGHGPRAANLDAKVPDLTRLAARNRGIFPIERVEQLLSSRTALPVTHAGIVMPTWGVVFSGAEPDPAAAKLRAHNIARYLESRQK